MTAKAHVLNEILNKVGTYLEQRDWDGVLKNLSNSEFHDLLDALIEANVKPFSELERLGKYLDFTKYLYWLKNYDISYMRASYLLASTQRKSLDLLNIVEDVMSQFHLFNAYISYDDEGQVEDYLYTMRDIKWINPNTKLIRRRGTWDE